MLLSILFSSFWLFHFLKATFETGFLQFGYSQWLLDWHSYFWNNLAGVFLALGLSISFYLLYKQNKEGNWLLFFSPVLFFFQAEDGIRDWSVTGVQTCALPI